MVLLEYICQLVPSGAAEWETENAKFSQSHEVTLPQVAVVVALTFVSIFLFRFCFVFAVIVFFMFYPQYEPIRTSLSFRFL